MMRTHTDLSAAKSKEMATTASIKAMQSNTKIPAGKPIPFGATPTQIEGAQVYEALYYLDLILCLDIKDAPSRTICINSSYAEYCMNFDSCFPV